MLCSDSHCYSVFPRYNKRRLSISWQRKFWKFRNFYYCFFFLFLTFRFCFYSGGYFFLFKVLHYFVRFGRLNFIPWSSITRPKWRPDRAISWQSCWSLLIRCHVHISIMGYQKWRQPQHYIDLKPFRCNFYGNLCKITFCKNKAHNVSVIFCSIINMYIVSRAKQHALNCMFHTTRKFF